MKGFSSTAEVVSPGKSCRSGRIFRVYLPLPLTRVRRTFATRRKLPMALASRPLVIAPSILPSDFSRLGEAVRAVAAAAHQEDLRCASDDLAVRPLSRSLCQGGLRSYHGACGGRSASASLAA